MSLLAKNKFLIWVSLFPIRSPVKPGLLQTFFFIPCKMHYFLGKKHTFLWGIWTVPKTKKKCCKKEMCRHKCYFSLHIADCEPNEDKSELSSMCVRMRRSNTCPNAHQHLFRFEIQKFLLSSNLFWLFICDMHYFQHEQPQKYPYTGSSYMLWENEPRRFVLSKSPA